MRRLDEEPAAARGEPAIGTAEPRLPQAAIRSLEGIFSKDEVWRALSGAGAGDFPTD